MWAPNAEAISLLAALAAGFLASPHCAGMCGPLRAVAREGVPFQLGRLAGYLSLGYLAGTLGFFLPPQVSLPIFAVGILLASFHWLPLGAWGRFAHRLLREANPHPLLLGLASSLLPCGLLHWWLAAAAASASPWLGAGLLAALWIGSLPALEAGKYLAHRVLGPWRKSHPRLVPFFFLALAMLPLYWRTSLPVNTAEAGGSTEPLVCHGTRGPSQSDSLRASIQD